MFVKGFVCVVVFLLIIVGLIYFNYRGLIIVGIIVVVLVIFILFLFFVFSLFVILKI